MAVLSIFFEGLIFLLQISSLFAFGVVGAVLGLALAAISLDKITSNDIFDDIFLFPACGFGALVGILLWGVVWN
jgi:hypothetical protein